MESLEKFSARIFFFILSFLLDAAGRSICPAAASFAMITEAEKHKFYHSAAWKRKREGVLRRDHYECQECRRRVIEASRAGILLPPNERKIKRAVLVHHIIPFEIAPARGLDDDNLEALCADCHNKIHGRTTNRLKKTEAKKRVTPEQW